MEEKYFWQKNLPQPSDMSDPPDCPHVKSFPDVELPGALEQMCFPDAQVVTLLRYA
jgi:hypothetical protein